MYPLQPMKIYLFLSLSAALLMQTACARQEISRPWNEDVIYFVMTDRFFDGDPANNRPAGSDPALYDPSQSDIDRYHGGDFRGLELALESGYFNALGVTTIWITPPVRNVWYSGSDLHGAPKTGYHGYWAQDFLDIDPHLVSARSLDGSRSYPDTREGRMQHYKDLVALAHGKGIKIVQDIVCNHAGPVFYYDADGDGEFDHETKAEWIQPYNRSGSYTNSVWADVPKWNMAAAQPSGSLRVLGNKVPLKGALGQFSSYGRRGMSSGSLGASDGEEVMCDFFALRDYDTSPDSPHFDDLVDDFVEIYAFYIETVGVDGFRIDTVKHVHHEFWDAFTERLRDRLGPERAKQLILFGEVYDGNPEALGRYTYKSNWPQDTALSIDSMLNFQFCYAVRDYLRTGNDSIGTAHGIENVMRVLSGASRGESRHFYNQTPGADGLNASQKVVNFVENHDGINRFRVRGVSEARHFLANAITLLMPGIPCLYYGSEVALLDTGASPHEDSETGRLTYIRANDDGAFRRTKDNDHFQSMAELIQLRKEESALHGFDIHPLWVDSGDSARDDGIFAFARGTKDGDAIVVVVNASQRRSSTSIPGYRMTLVDSDGVNLLRQGDRLEAITLKANGGRITHIDLDWEDARPLADIQVPPESVNLFRVVRD